MIQELIDITLRILFPPRCAVCRTFSENTLCSDCLSKIVMIKKHEGYVFSICAYKGVIEKAVKLLKFRGKTKLSAPLGRLLADHNPFHDADAIIPVPLHKNRLKERGVNQSALISSELSRKLGVPVIENALIRKKDTKHMFELGRKERRENINNAFEVISAEKVKGASLILVDDIYTTGITASACRRTLLGSGAKNVRVLVLSRASLDMI